jgi:PAS domain S-box-containing protein
MSEGKNTPAGAWSLLADPSERFRLLVEGVKDYAIFMLDAGGRVATWNVGAERIKGYRAEEIVGQHFSCFYPPEDVRAGKPEWELRGATAAGRLEDEGWRLRKDGSRFWADVVITAVRDKQGTLVGFAKVTRDLTERRRVETALRASEEQFRALAATANDAIISADSQGNIIYFNPYAERVFGYAAGEVAGQPITLLMPERFHEAHRAGLRRYLATGEARVVGQTVELVGKRRDGTEFPIELSLASWQRQTDTVFTAFVRDITARKQADEALQRYAAQLEAANAELDAFTYSVSHDLRAPLRAMDGYAGALLEDYGGVLDEQGRRFLRVIRDSATQMGHLIDSLLAFARLGRQQLATAPIDMTALAEAVVADLRGNHAAEPFEMSVRRLPPTRGDSSLLRQVFANLIGNAFKFTRGRPDPRVEIGARAEGADTVYYVKDNGVGFDQRYAGKLFKVFSRLHRVEEFEGSGVGLALVQRIVQRHGGRVWAEGQVNAGATFCFTLHSEAANALTGRAGSS